MIFNDVNNCSIYFCFFFRIRSQLNPVGDQEGGRDLIELLKKMENLDELRLITCVCVCLCALV